MAPPIVRGFDPSQPDCVTLEDGSKMVRVPAAALAVAVDSVRAGMAKKKCMQDELEQLEAEAKAMELKLQRRQEQLDKCATAFCPSETPRLTPVAPSRPSGGSAASNASAFFRQRSKSVLFSSSVRDLVGDVMDEMNTLTAREGNVREKYLTTRRERTCI
jgi:hypothetical protein